MLRAGDHRVRACGELKKLTQCLHEQLFVGFGILAHGFDEHQIAARLSKWCSSHAQFRRHHVVEVAPHRFETCQARAQPLSAVVEQLHHLLEALHADDGGLARDRLRLQREHQPRDDAQRSLAADEQVLEVVSGVVLECLAKMADDLPIRKHGFQADDGLACHAVAQDPVASRIRRGDASDVAGALAADVDGKQQAASGRSFLGLLQLHASLDGHGLAGCIDFLDGVQPVQRQDDLSGPGQCSIHEAGHSALHGDRQPQRMRGPHGCRKVLRRARAQYGKRSGAALATPVGAGVCRYGISDGQQRRIGVRRQRGIQGCQSLVCSGSG